MKAVFCVPTTGGKPYKEFVASMKASVPLLDEAGIEHAIVQEAGCPYISFARAKMLRKALDAKADVIVFLDHDVGWEPDALVRLIQTEGDVVAATYRFKKDEEAYMGTIKNGPDMRPVVREDGSVQADWVPAGFLKVTEGAVARFMEGYPHLCFGKPYSLHVDLFNHGAHNGMWYGEDYSFSRNWADLGGEIWIIPDVRVDHYTLDGTAYRGQFHEFLLRQPGGSHYQEKRE
jgi:glycosyltransferase involved in cell wall biosynthesis